MQVSWKAFTLFCGKFIQDAVYQILSELGKLCTGCDKYVLVCSYPFTVDPVNDRIICMMVKSSFCCPAVRWNTRGSASFSISAWHRCSRLWRSWEFQTTSKDCADPRPSCITVAPSSGTVTKPANSTVLLCLNLFSELLILLQFDVC